MPPTTSRHHLLAGRRAPLAATVVALLVGGACATEHAAGSGPAALRELDDPRAAVVVAADAAAELDSVEAELDFELTMPMGGDRLRASVRIDADLRGEVEVDGGGEYLELRGDGERIWIRPRGEMAELLPPGATWVSVRVDDFEDLGVDDAFGFDFDLVFALRGASEVEVLGQGTVAGDPVWRLRAGSIDLDAARAASTPDERDRLDSSFTVSGESSITAEEIAIDGEGRLRHLVLEATSGPANRAGDLLPGGEIRLRLSLEILDPAPDIATPQPPPPSEVVELTEVPDLLAQLAS